MIEQQMAKVDKRRVGHLLPYIPHYRSSEYEIEVKHPTAEAGGMELGHPVWETGIISDRLLHAQA
jgi:hypothetical protein